MIHLNFVECSICNVTFNTRTSLDAHFAQEHTIVHDPTTDLVRSIEEFRVSHTDGLTSVSDSVESLEKSVNAALREGDSGLSEVVRNVEKNVGQSLTAVRRSIDVCSSRVCILQEAVEKSMSVRANTKLDECLQKLSILQDEPAWASSMASDIKLLHSQQATLAVSLARMEAAMQKPAGRKRRRPVRFGSRDNPESFFSTAVHDGDTSDVVDDDSYLDVNINDVDDDDIDDAFFGAHPTVQCMECNLKVFKSSMTQHQVSFGHRVNAQDASAVRAKDDIIADCKKNGEDYMDRFCDGCMLWFYRRRGRDCHLNGNFHRMNAGEPIVQKNGEPSKKQKASSSSSASSK